MTYAAAIAPLSKAGDNMFGLVNKNAAMRAAQEVRDTPLSLEERFSMVRELLGVAQRLARQARAAMRPVEDSQHQPKAEPFNHS